MFLNQYKILCTGTKYFVLVPNILNWYQMFQPTCMTQYFWALEPQTLGFPLPSCPDALPVSHGDLDASSTIFLTITTITMTMTIIIIMNLQWYFHEVALHPLIPDRIRILEVLIFVEGGKPENPEKTLRASREPTTNSPTSFPGSLILPPRASEERPWFGLVTCYCDN